MLLAAAVAVALVCRRVGFPYTVALVMFGLIVAVIAPGVSIHVTPDLVLLVLLPALVFEAAFHLDIDGLRRSLGAVVLLAVPGVLLTALTVAVALHALVALPLDLAFLVGAMVAATDPVAVIAAFRGAGGPHALRSMVEGESLFNDGTAIVLFTIALRVISEPVSVSDAVLTFAGVIVVSIVIGCTAGVAASRLVAKVDDHLIEISISVLLAYGTYLLADAFHESGVIATVVAGITLGSYGRRIGMSQRTQDAIDVVWEFLAFVLTALVFLLVGLAITVTDLSDALPAIGVGIVAVLLSRAVATYGLLGGLPRLARRSGPPREWLHILFWAGLRGAVAVALALSLPLDVPQRGHLQAITFGIVLFTLLAQGSTIGWVVRTALAKDGEVETVGGVTPTEA